MEATYHAITTHQRPKMPLSWGVLLLHGPWHHHSKVQPIRATNQTNESAPLCHQDREEAPVGVQHVHHEPRRGGPDCWPDRYADIILRFYYRQRPRYNLLPLKISILTSLKIKIVPAFLFSRKRSHCTDDNGHYNVRLWLTLVCDLFTVQWCIIVYYRN